MGFLDRVNKFFGNVKVKEVNNEIRITGIDGFVMRKHIAKMWETDLINKQMFNSITDTGVSFHTFFLPDIVHILTKLREDPNSTWSAKGTIDKIMHGIVSDTWFGKTVGEVESMVDESRLKLLKWKPLPHQLEFLRQYGDKMPRYDLRGFIVAFAPGGGKEQPFDAAIKIPGGWSTMGDMKIGTKVSTPDGKEAAVIGVYPQGLKDIYRITFEDGRWTECGDEHLWKIYNGAVRVSGSRGVWQTVPLRDIRINLNSPLIKDRLYVQLPLPEEIEDKDLPLDPYVLGILLGDGHFRSDQIHLSSEDQFIIDEVNKLLPNEYILKFRGSCDYGVIHEDGNRGGVSSEILRTIRNLGLSDTRSDTKFIPDIYMNASPQQKLGLLQGLMDSDGTVSENKSASFCTVSNVMAKQVQYLIRELGGLAKIREKKTSFSYNGEKRAGKLAYQINIRYSDSKSLFRLPRKKDLLPENYQYADRLRLRIKEIEYIGKKEAQCIAIDHPDHLYITDDFIVTHNTMADLMVATCVIPPSIAEVKIIISPKKALHLVWEKSVRALFKKPPTYWCCDSGKVMPIEKTEYYVFNFERLDDAYDLAQKLNTRNIRYFVIVDESHNFADFKSGRTQKLVKLQTLRDDTFFIWTSGTPVLKHAAELTSYLKCADKRFTPEAEKRFRRIYTAAPGRANEIFNHRLGKMMAFIVGKSEFSPTKPIVKELPVKLPPSLANKFLMSTVKQDMKNYIVERLGYYDNEMKSLRHVVNKGLEYHEHTLKTHADRKLFNAYVKNLKIIMKNPDLLFRSLLDDTRAYERTKLLPSLVPTDRKEFRSALSAVKNIKLKVRGEALGKILGKRRSECAAALGYYCKPEQIMKESLSKTLFFASSVLPIEILDKHLKEKGFSPLMVYGGTNTQLTKMIEDFTVYPNLNPICATMQSLSEAVPVIAASTVVLLNRPFRQAVWDQVIARADRLGQQFPVTVIEVTLDTGDQPNVSSTTDAILVEVRELISAIIGDDFGGPDPDEREYQTAIDASQEDPDLIKIDDIEME